MAEQVKPEYVIEIENVFQAYPDKIADRDRVILNNINLKIRKGELVTLVGPSGCGKSTLLRLILGCEKPVSGAVKVDGSLKEDVNRDCGIVFQKYSLFPHKTVLKNISFGLELEGLGLLQRLFLWPFYLGRLKRYRSEAMEYLDSIGFAAKEAAKHPFELSGGMQQRVAIAQAMIMKPKVLLMDEPFGALDDQTREKMQLFLLKQWEETGMTIIFVTHHLEEALFLGTRTIVLSQHYAENDGKAFEGAKVTLDKEVPEAHSNSTDQKYTPEFNALLQQIRHSGLNPKNRQPIDSFDLSHPDSIKNASPAVA